jgi:hypothetical protein
MSYGQRPSVASTQRSYALPYLPSQVALSSITYMTDAKSTAPKNTAANSQPQIGYPLTSLFTPRTIAP